MLKPLMPWCAVSVVAVLLGGLPAAKGESPLDKLDRTAVPDRLPKEVVSVIPGGMQEPCLCAFTTDGQTLAVADKTGRVCLWHFGDRSPREGPVVNTGVGAVRGLAFAPDGKTVAVSGTERLLEVWDCLPVQPRLQVALQDGTKQPLCQLHFAPSGKLLAGASAGTVFVWQVEAEQLRPRLPLEHDTEVTALAFSPDSRTIATGQRDGGDVTLWEVATCQACARLPGNRHAILAFHYSSDGRTLTWADTQGNIWSQERSTEKKRMTGRLSGIPCAETDFSTDGKVIGVGRFMSIQEDRGSELMVQSLAARFKWRLPGFVVAPVWAPDGRHLALPHSEGHVYILHFPR